MTEDIESKEHVYIRAICSVIPLLSEEVAIDIIQDLRKEAEKTPLMPTARRISNFGLSLATLGGVAVLIFFLDDIYTSLQTIKVAGISVGNVSLYPLTLLGLISLSFISKVIMVQLRDMNKGVSPFGKGEHTLLTGFFEFVFGVLFLSLLGSLLVQINAIEFLYFIALATFIVGILVAAIGMTLNGFLSLQADLTTIIQSLRRKEMGDEVDSGTTTISEEK